ncbi:Type 1 glutamine amidotransferase [Sulfidibacter corallicola]|uniref:Type 1 glutamine amidotransferase n=1 Tax=Sulfidibacter corallicola TaxID=2818388 RepID=A0A8A4TMQ5_SULCO|nr:type 1 glutamine amidotransferase [Sulfidibacter corallicola]QTD47875.1 type 1 glutamine amidotransferase [Sulfidibacter corallicola]
MRVAVLLTGYATGYTAQKYGTYADLFRHLLEEPGSTWDTFDVIQGEYPRDLADYDAYVVTGSASDAHATEPWIQDLNRKLREAFDCGRKILGVCFGHQAVANALGGASHRADQGWEVGIHALDLTEAATKKTYGHNLPTNLNVLQTHRDEVKRLPPGAELLASSAQTPIQMYAVGHQVLCMQGHPEYFKDIVSDLLEGRALRGLIPEDVAVVARQSLATMEPDRNAFQVMLKTFLYG